MAGAAEQRSPVETGWAVFLDFDGTLADIAERPDAVVVEPGLPVSLRALHGACGGAVAIVTGRSVETIESFLPGLGLDICGLHGMERRIGGRLERVDVPGLAVFRQVVPALVAPLEALPGVVIEDKVESVAFHWRRAPEAESRLREAAERLVREAVGFRLQEGKALVEVVPTVSGKGGAVSALMEHGPYHGRRPVFIGDDITDENGFAVAQARGGLAVKVGPGATIARHRVAAPGDLRRRLRDTAAFLDALAHLEAA